MQAARRARAEVQRKSTEPAVAESLDPALQRAVDEAEAELSRGEYVEHDEVMAKLRRWADGA